jgi:hypothetical protein
MDEVEYLVVANSMCTETTVIGFKNACDEAYEQCRNSSCPYEEVSVIELPDGGIVDKFTKDMFDISRR